MRIRTLCAAGIALAALTTIATTANAQSFDRSAFDACNPEAWDQFGYAVENRDYDLLAQMMNDAQYKVCGFYETVELLVCDINPAACLEPAGGGPDDVPIDDRNDNRPDGPFPGQAPGESLGNENDGGDSGNDPGGNDPGGNDPGGDDGGREPGAAGPNG